MSDTVTDPVAALAEQWDTEAQTARDEADGLPRTEDNVQRHRALRNLARINGHHAEQLRAALADAR